MRLGGRQEGGAYLLAVTVLVVLTGLGIVLSETASTERRLGSADRARLQALNAADSGLALATARILAGEATAGSRELVFGVQRSLGLARVSRVTVDPPVVAAVRPCEPCAPADGEWARVSYALSATGELALRSAAASGRSPRVVARAAVEALLTLQPWPAPGAAPVPGADVPPCTPGAWRRVYRALAEELHPPACRFAPQRLPIAAVDTETGRTCRVSLPVCVLLSDWRER